MSGKRGRCGRLRGEDSPDKKSLRYSRGELVPHKKREKNEGGRRWQVSWKPLTIKRAPVVR